MPNATLTFPPRNELCPILLPLAPIATLDTTSHNVTHSLTQICNNDGVVCRRGNGNRVYNVVSKMKRGFVAFLRSTLPLTPLFPPQPGLFFLSFLFFHYNTRSLPRRDFSSYSTFLLRVARRDPIPQARKNLHVKKKRKDVIADVYYFAGRVAFIRTKKRRRQKPQCSQQAYLISCSFSYYRDSSRLSLCRR